MRRATKIKNKEEKTMGTFHSTEEAREYFKKDVYAYNAGMVLEELGEDYAVCSVPVHEGLFNANGSVQGGAIFTLADLAFAVASNFDRPASTVSLVGHAEFLSMTKGSILYAETRLIKDGRSTRSTCPPSPSRSASISSAPPRGHGCSPGRS